MSACPRCSSELTVAVDQAHDGPDGIDLHVHLGCPACGWAPAIVTHTGQAPRLTRPTEIHRGQTFPIHNPHPIGSPVTVNHIEGAA